MPKHGTLSSKAIVTNQQALRRKHYVEAAMAIETAMTRPINANRLCRLDTRCARLDGAGVSASRVRDPKALAENESASDAVTKKPRPEYLVILGYRDAESCRAIKTMKNKLYLDSNADPDPDHFAWADLPYASDAASSQISARYLGPTRAIGRIPDFSGASLRG